MPNRHQHWIQTQLTGNKFDKNSTTTLFGPMVEHQDGAVMTLGPETRPSALVSYNSFICLDCMFLEDVVISTTLGKSAGVVDGFYGRYRGAMVVVLSLTRATTTVEVWTISFHRWSFPCWCHRGAVNEESGNSKPKQFCKGIHTLPGFPYFRTPVTPFLASFRWVERQKTATQRGACKIPTLV